jgi:hypothetical protein
VNPLPYNVLRQCRCPRSCAVATIHPWAADDEFAVRGHRFGDLIGVVVVVDWLVLMRQMCFSADGGHLPVVADDSAADEDYGVVLLRRK